MSINSRPSEPWSWHQFLESPSSLTSKSNWSNLTIFLSSSQGKFNTEVHHISVCLLDKCLLDYEVRSLSADQNFRKYFEKNWLKVHPLFHDKYTVFNVFLIFQYLMCLTKPLKTVKITLEINPPVQIPVSLIQTTFTQIYNYVSVAVLVHNRKSYLKMNFKPCRSNNTEKRFFGPGHEDGRPQTIHHFIRPCGQPT